MCAPELQPLAVGFVIFLSSLISLRFGLSVAIVEIVLGALAGHLGVEAADWMLYLAEFGGIVLTFLAGTEIDPRLMKTRLKECLLIGGSSFLAPFVAVAALAHYWVGWSPAASLIAGTTFSAASIALVYSVLVEMGLSATALGRFLMASTFVANMAAVLALSAIFTKPTAYTLLFLALSVVVIALATGFSRAVLESPRLKDKVIEPEIKYVFLLLLAFMSFAKLGAGHAILPAFVLGLVMSRHFTETAVTRRLRDRLRTVSYAWITPLFFIVGGLKVSFPLIASAFGLFLAFLAVKLVTKILSVYFLARRFLPGGPVFATLLMSTGLTFGIISSLYGLEAGIIDRSQYSLLVGVLIASSVLPTFVAQRWFAPVNEEDLLEMGT